MKAPKFIEQINWVDLLKQKRLLLQTINNDNVSPEHKEGLEGILAVIDAIQDYAVDEMGLSETDVFDFDSFDYADESVVDIDDYSPENQLCTDGLYVGETKLVRVCSNCNSDNVKFQVWADANTLEIIDFDQSEGFDEVFGVCNDCGCEVEIYDTLLKKDAKIIGYQVVGVEGEKHEGEIHPSIYSGDTLNKSNCVYNIAQCYNMIAPAEFSDSFMVWKLLTIWSGDIENPEMMFEGDFR